MIGKSILLSAFCMALLAMAGPQFAGANGVYPAAGEEDELDPIHHSVDGNYLDFEPFGKVELPRIFIVSSTDGLGVDFFLTSTAAVQRGGYEATWDAALGEGEDAATPGDAEPLGGYYEAHLAPPGGGHVLVDMSITRHLIFAWIGMLIVWLLFTRVARMYKAGIGRETAPRGLLQNMLETLILVVRDDIARPAIGAKTDRYLPYLLSAFFFILTCNLLGLVPFGATATSNLMVTGVLAVFTFVLTQVGGTKDYWMHILWPPGVPTFVKPILIPVEILGIFTKPFALAIRLFANMTAGHLVILSLIGLIFSFTNLFGSGAGYGVAPVSVAFALFIYLLELLVSFIQAYVFTMLSALFIGMAVEEHDHGHHVELSPTH